MPPIAITIKPAMFIPSSGESFTIRKTPALTIVEEWDNLLGYLWLVLFPEAFINGTLVTALVVFYPQWMETFNRTRYLQAPWRQD